MKMLFSFLKTTVIGGLFILLPLLLLEMMMAEIFQLLVALTEPITDLFPREWLEAIHAPVLLAVLIILLASFVLGLSARSASGQRLGRWLERNTVGRIPLYGVLKGLAARLIEIGEGSAFKPAVLLSDNGQREFAYLIEEHGDGNATIMLPWAPTPLSGSIKIVPTEHLEILDRSLGEMTRVLSRWGVWRGDWWSVSETTDPRCRQAATAVSRFSPSPARRAEFRRRTLRNSRPETPPQLHGNS